jgi:hypothetical protein
MELPVPLEGSIRNMAAIEAIFRSAKSGKWEEPLVTGLLEEKTRFGL